MSPCPWTHYLFFVLSALQTSRQNKCHFVPIFPISSIFDAFYAKPWLTVILFIIVYVLICKVHSCLPTKPYPTWQMLSFYKNKHSLRTWESSVFTRCLYNLSCSHFRSRPNLQDEGAVEGQWLMWYCCVYFKRLIMCFDYKHC